VDGAAVAGGAGMSALRQRYEHDGFAVVRHVIADHEIHLLRAHLAEQQLPPNGLVPLRLDADERARNVGSHPALLSVAEELLGTAVQPFGATYVVRQAGSTWTVSWHQDGEPWRRQWGIERAVTLWLALDASGPHNGGLRMIPGTHRGRLEPLEPVEDVLDVFGWASPAALVDASRAVDLVLDAGDLSAHHPAMVHASGPNPSTGPRRALSLRFRAA